MDRARAGAFAGLAAVGVWTVGWVLAGLIQGGSYDWASQEISDLGALTARHAWVWNLADSLGGALICVFALGILAVGGGSRAGRVGAVALFAIGVGSVVDGLAREDCPLSTSSACQGLRNGPGLSWHHQVHDVESAVVAVAPAVAPLSLAPLFARRGATRLRLVSLAGGTVIALAFAAYLVLRGGAGAGIAQRLAILAFCAWLLAASVWIARQSVPPRWRK